MASFNKVILMGNLTRDPELRYTPKGTAVAKLGVAVSRKWRNDTGEMQEETTFVDVDAFGKQAETIGQYLKKGRPIMIEGRLRLDQWEDKNSGQKRSKLNVVMESFQFLDSGRSDDQSGGGGGNYSSGGQSTPGRVSRPAAPEVQNDPDSLPADDDVPF